MIEKKSGVGGFSKILCNFQSGSWQMIRFAHKVGRWGEKRPKTCLRNTWMVPNYFNPSPVYNACFNECIASKNWTTINNSVQLLIYKQTEVTLLIYKQTEVTLSIYKQTEVKKGKFCNPQSCLANITLISRTFLPYEFSNEERKKLLSM